MAWNQELAVAKAALERAGEVALGYWRDGVEAEAKADQSPVTTADRHCERLIVQDLCQHFPDDGILGEEGANKAAGSGRRWIIDPIDGTRDFVRRNRLWCHMAALEDGGETVVGVIHFPALAETYWATRGGGAYRNGERIRVSGVCEVGKAVLCVNSFANIHRSGFSRNLIEWMRHFWAVRSMGGALDSMFIAAGHAEAWIEQSAQPWDLAATQVIAEEAGARFFNFDGGRSIYGGNCVLCVPGLETVMRRFVSS